MIIRELRTGEKEMMKEFLYLAIFIPEGMEPPEKEIIERPELKIYYEDFGKWDADKCLVAETNGDIVGMVWTRIMNDYGHVDDDTPSLAISVRPEYRGQRIGTRLIKKMIDLLRRHGYKRISLSVQKANRAADLYCRIGFHTTDENEQEYIMVCEL